MNNNLEKITGLVEKFIFTFLMCFLVEIIYVCICGFFVMICWNFVLIPLNIVVEKISYLQTVALLYCVRYFCRVVNKRFLVRQIKK